MSCLLPLVYLAALGRQPAAADVTYWEPSGPAAVAHILESSEARLAERSIADYYRSVFGRDPDIAGYTYWTSMPKTDALWGIVTSAEAGCPPLEVHPAGWVDLGHGVWGPVELLEIRRCESGGDYQARNKRSSAAGAYQMTQGTARYVAADAGRPDLIGYGDNVAGSWANADQDAMAVHLLEMVGWDAGSSMAWQASEHCWRW